MEGNELTGAVIVFDRGVTPEMVNEALEELAKKVAIQHDVIRTFDPDWGEPVWYIP